MEQGAGLAHAAAHRLGRNREGHGSQRVGGKDESVRAGGAPVGAFVEEVREEHATARGQRLPHASEPKGVARRREVQQGPSCGGQARDAVSQPPALRALARAAKLPARLPEPGREAVVTPAPLGRHRAGEAGPHAEVAQVASARLGEDAKGRLALFLGEERAHEAPVRRAPLVEGGRGPVGGAQRGAVVFGDGDGAAVEALSAGGGASLFVEVAEVHEQAAAIVVVARVPGPAQRLPIGRGGAVEPAGLFVELRPVVLQDERPVRLAGALGQAGAPVQVALGRLRGSEAAVRIGQEREGVKGGFPVLFFLGEPLQERKNLVCQAGRRAPVGLARGVGALGRLQKQVGARDQHLGLQPGRFGTARVQRAQQRVSLPEAGLRRIEGAQALVDRSRIHQEVRARSRSRRRGIGDRPFVVARGLRKTALNVMQVPALAVHGAEPERVGRGLERAKERLETRKRDFVLPGTTQREHLPVVEPEAPLALRAGAVAASRARRKRSDFLERPRRASRLGAREQPVAGVWGRRAGERQQKGQQSSGHRGRVEGVSCNRKGKVINI